MTDDSVTDNSVCKDEWTWALKYKKPIIPLHFHPKADLPFRLNNLQYIEFARDFTTGISQLRERITNLDSPMGILAELKHRLADANRDLRRAIDDDKLRIQAEIEDLNKQIEVQQKIVKNPKKAEEQTQKNIDTGLERERQPEKPIAGKTSTRFINPPPGIAPTYFQDRLIETKQIADFLHNDAQRLMTIVGRAGVGKTAMICRLLKGIESGKLPDELGDMKADGIVYLSEAGSHRINFANIFADLSKLLPKEVAESLDGIYKNPQTSTGDKMRKLLDAFESGRFILLLDNFENLIDSESLHIKDSELSDALNALLQATQHTIKVIITTRIAPRDLALVEPGRQHPLSLDDGLESPYAENALREMDADGRVGLKSAPDALLNKAREKTRGYPRALEALYAILSVDRYTTLEELLKLELPKEVVEKLVGEAFSRLDTTAQKVMQSLAMYNRPVSPAAIDYLLQPHLPSIDSALVLNRLVNMHFARREAGKYYLHPADREYALSTIPEIEKEDAFTQHDLLTRAADYFAAARKPRAEWKKLDDLSAQLAEFDLRCAAGDYDSAGYVLGEIDFDYLRFWGHQKFLIGLYKKVIENLGDSILSIGLSINMGHALSEIGDSRTAISVYEDGLASSKRINSHYQEGVALDGIGQHYLNLGNDRKAIEHFEQALNVFRKIGNTKAESNELNNKGFVFISLEEYQHAIESLSQAIQIADKISFVDVQIEGRIGSAQAYLFQNDLINARATIEAALGHDVPAYNHNASALHGIIALRQGDEVTARGSFVRAIQQADEILSKTAEYYSALDAKGLAICGLILAGRGDPSMPTETNDGKSVPPDKSTVSAGRVAPTINDAIETFRKARKIAPHAGVVKSVLRLFDELVKCDEEGVLKDVRKAAEGVE
jgi:tetratricopeptide (TPR) repeat protein